MTLKEKGFNGEIYKLAKITFSKKMAKHFATLFENVLENLLKTNIFTWGMVIFPSVCHLYNSQLALYRCYNKMHAKIRSI